MCRPQNICASLLFLVLIRACFPPASLAQSNDEMLILRMYYAEKDLVVSSTRHPKPISQVAENITVVTAKEIKEMNAHTVADVLNRIPGIFVNFHQDFGASSLVRIQGSGERHVLVLVDGVTWNFLASGHAETNSIPLGIIERIEIIRGPASSAWGSSLGGVINIITKQAGDTERPNGAITASYGEKNTQDYRAEVSGGIGSAGYYIFGGHQESDGLRSSRYFDNDSFYSKVGVPISKNLNIGLSAGYSKLHIALDPMLLAWEGDTYGLFSTGSTRSFFATGFLDAAFNKKLSAKVSFYTFTQKSALTTDVSMNYGPREFDEKDVFDEETRGGNAKIVWEGETQTIVVGAEFEHGKLDQTISLASTDPYNTDPDIDKWAVYGNDTIVINGLTITPGIRYDHNDITGSFTSPSLGVTYRLGEESILRASVARGFTIPPLSWTSGGAYGLEPNPYLEPEEVWSYQAGAESSAVKYLWIKATLYRHDIEDELMEEPTVEGANRIYGNKGETTRHGFEVQAETLPVCNLSLLAGVAYVRMKDKEITQEPYSLNVGVKYDNTRFFKAMLLGQKVWWDVPDMMADGNDFICDLNISKSIYSRQTSAIELFFAAHNIFNGAQYDLKDSRIPGRWIEGGISVRF